MAHALARESAQKLEWFSTGNYTVCTGHGKVLGRAGVVLEVVKAVFTLRFGAVIHLMKRALKEDPFEVKEGLKLIFLDCAEFTGAVAKAKQVFNSRFPDRAFPLSPVAALAAETIARGYRGIDAPSSPTAASSSSSSVSSATAISRDVQLIMDKQLVAETMVSFTSRLLQTMLHEKKAEPIGFSPFSLYITLAMILPGLSPADQNDVLAKIDPRLQDIGLPRFVFALQAILKGTQEGQGSGLQFKMGNALAIKLTDQERDVPLPPAYINGLVKFFDVKVIGIKDGSRDISALNEWICLKSGLKDVLPGHASRNTRAMIIQALSFLGKFSAPMDKNMTLSRQFVGANRGPVQAWFMYGEVAPKGADPSAQAARAKNMYAFRVGNSTHSKYFYEGVCLNYQRDDYGNSGYFRIWIKPANPEISIEEFLNNLDLQKVCQEIRNIPLSHRCDRETHPVEFHLPKTRMDLALDFIPILKMGLGLNELLLPGALQINNIIQRCFMKEDEEGTQVQAATVAYVSRSMPRQPPAPVVFDRPFVGVVMSDEAVIGASVVDAESLDLV